MPKVVEAETPGRAWVSMSWRSVFAVFVAGIITGLATYAMYVIFERFIFEPILCRDSAAIARCDSKDTLAGGAAMILGSLLGLVLMVRERVFRPLLVVLAVLISLWGVFTVTVNLPWFGAMVAVALATGLAYALFAWLAQPASFVVAAVLVVIAVALVRLVVGM